MNARTGGIVLLVLAGLLFVTALAKVGGAPNVGYAVGLFLPSVLCLIFGLKLTQKP